MSWESPIIIVDFANYQIIGPPLNVFHRVEVLNLKDKHQEKKDELDQTLDMEMNTVCQKPLFYIGHPTGPFIENTSFYILDQSSEAATKFQRKRTNCS